MKVGDLVSYQDDDDLPTPDSRFENILGIIIGKEKVYHYKVIFFLKESCAESTIFLTNLKLLSEA
jgi:hypothetical protein